MVHLPFRPPGPRRVASPGLRPVGCPSPGRRPRPRGDGGRAEAIATVGLLATILGCRAYREPVTAFAVAAWITGAYWFTASTSFANPAVTLARGFTDSFAGIRPDDIPGFVLAQLVGLALVLPLLRARPRGPG